MISKGFFETLELVAQERNLPIEDVLSKVEIALAKACATEGFTGEIQIEFNHEKKRIRIFELKTVTDDDDIDGTKGQITLEEAKEIKDRVKIGSVLKREINLDADVGRKGATQFKQLFTQGLKELARKRAFDFFKERENEMINAQVLRIDAEAVILSIGLDYQTYMPIKDALPGEVLNVGDTIKVYITKVEETGKGPKVYVSRAHRDIIKRLFENIVPEIASGVIEVMGIARDPGLRTKIGVKSNNPTVDAKGACVGVQGVRVKQINNALNGERVDIFIWHDDPVQLIAEALTPAKVLSVLPDEEEKKSIVIVPDSQFSLAIGKGGQNARLASQVTGWKIDIKDESTSISEGMKYTLNVKNNL